MGIYGILTETFTKPIIARHVAKEYREGLAEAYREGYEKGRALGRAEGVAEVNQAWRSWYARLLEAKVNGLPFDEPTPDQFELTSDESCCGRLKWRK